MELTETALYFEPWRFQPKTERLFELFDCFRRFGYKTAIVDWRGLFPWSEYKFRNRFAYSEHALVEIHRRAAEAGLQLVCRLSWGGGMGSFLSHPGYRHLRLREHDPDVINIDAPGAMKFLTDLLDDMVALLPELAGIYLDPGPVPVDRASAGSRDLNGSGILPEEPLRRFLDGVGNLRIIAAPCLSDQSLLRDQCIFMKKTPENFLDDGQSGFPPTLELYLDLMPRGGSEKTDSDVARADEGDVDRTRSTELRKKCAEVSFILEKCWESVRQLSEESYLPLPLGYTPEMSYASLFDGGRQLDRWIEESAVSLSDISRTLEPLLAPGVFDGWKESLLQPLRDQAAGLKQKARMVKVWIEKK